MDRGHPIGRPKPRRAADPRPTRTPSRERRSAADQRGEVPRPSRRADGTRRAGPPESRPSGGRTTTSRRHTTTRDGRKRKNARARARYRERRLTESARLNNRTGMHALAIQIDTRAYRAVKAQVLQRKTSIAKAIGETLSDSSPKPIASARAAGPRWRRTGEGRRANQHTRIDIDDEGWLTVRHDAIRHGFTIARWIGLNLETWARRGDVEES